MKILRRVNHIAGFFNLSLVQAAMDDPGYHKQTTAKAILHEISDADPTGDCHLMFLARLYSTRQMLVKDMPTIKAYLTEFEATKKGRQLKVTDGLLTLKELLGMLHGIDQVETV